MLLDESHLELVEDVLKETNFNDKDWYKLASELGISLWSLKYSNKENINLKECLREWLSTDTFRSFLRIRPDRLSPTLYDLAAALKRVDYIEAGEYIIKTCKLIIMFNDQCY